MQHRGFCLVLATCVGCSGGNAVDKDDTDTAPDATCDGGAVHVLQIAQDLAMGPAVDGAAVDYGIPPQGGAPYAPFEIRMKAPLGTERLEVEAWARDPGTGTLMGSVTQSQGFLCSNVGVHEGWRFGGEVHIRFWSLTLQELEGREVDIEIALTLPDGEMLSATTEGVLAWTL